MSEASVRTGFDMPTQTFKLVALRDAAKAALAVLDPESVVAKDLSAAIERASR